MNVERRVCNRQTIEDFLADRLSDEDVRAFEDHIENCLSCRESLDRLAAERTWWEDARGYLAAPGGASSELPNQLAQESPLALFGLQDCLSPTDDPRMLGRLGGYEVMGIIGQGGMGIVLKAFDAPLNRYVAIKVLSPQLAQNAAARQRFAREAKAAATVVHANVIAIHAVAEASGMPYFVMPYVRGPSLEKRLQQTGALPVLEIVRIGMQIAAGLAAAHAQGLVHRDIKPGNILLEEGVERVTITDFGLARLADDVSLTRSGVIAGTPQYMSPEQARGQAVDHRSDLYSLGSVLYALGTGRPPFRAETALGVLRLVEQGELQPIREINPDIPEWLAAVVERLQAKDPADRFQSAAEVAHLLEAFLAHLQQPTSRPEPPLPFDARAMANPGGGLAPARTSLLVLLCLAGLVSTAIALLGGFFQDGRDNPPKQAAGQGAKKEYAVTYQEPLKGQPQKADDFMLIGPEPDRCVKYEAEGLRVTLPGGRGWAPTGIVTGFGVSGDFDISVRYEVLQEPEQADSGNERTGTRIGLTATLNRPGTSDASIRRKITPDQPLHVMTLRALRQDPDSKPEIMGSGSPVRERTGRFRMVRSGADLACYLAEGDEQEFKLLAVHPFGADDIRDVRITGDTSGPRAVLDVRFSDLRISAASLLSQGMLPNVVNRGQGGRGSLLLVCLLLALATALFVLVGLGRWLRRRKRGAGSPAPPSQPEAALPAIAFPCPQCDRILRAKANLAGKKVRCAQCGTTVVVPELNAGNRA
jgi:hypothetical protein